MYKLARFTGTVCDWLKPVTLEEWAREHNHFASTLLMLKYPFTGY